MSFFRTRSIFIILLLTCISVNSQNYTIDGADIDDCTGNFYDTGGNQGGNHDYGNSENETITICPDAAGQAAGQLIQVDFASFLIEDGFDFLEIYDGPSTASPLLGVETGNSLDGLSVEATGTNVSGCLTFVFTSDWLSTEDGWDASISCITPCDRPVAGGTITGGTPLQICPGESVNFNDASTAAAGFTITDYLWDFGDGSTSTQENPSHLFSDVGDYWIQLEVTDDNGCVNTNRIDLQVWAGTVPTFTGTTPDFSICIDEIACLDGLVTPTTYVGNPNLNFAGTTFVPDGVGECFDNPLTMVAFSPGQTLTNINDLQDIFVNMEHSWLGDLQISIICPNGNSVILVSYNSDPSTTIGEPIFDPNPGAGVGYDYFWSPTSNNGTWDDNNAATLPSGTYESDNPLTGLVGCPLNGEWSLELCDDQGLDDGYVFEWSINFDPLLYPDPVTYTPVIAANCGGSSWSGPGIISTSGDCNNICINTTVAGDFDYDYSVTDDFGCSYDTTITVTVLPATNPTCPQCQIGYTLLTSACDPATNTYTSSGTVTFLDPPATGNLIIEDCDGNQDVLDVTTITSGVSFEITGQTPDGAACDLEFYFSDNTACTVTQTYNAPPDCTPVCFMSSFSVSQGACDGITNTFSLTDGTLGGIQFTDAPAGADLIVEVVFTNGDTYNVTFPSGTYSSPQLWELTGIPANGLDYTVTAFFDLDTDCSIALNGTAPVDCSCPASVGSFDTEINGQAPTNNGLFTLCYGDNFDILSTTGFTPPNDYSPATDNAGDPIIYDPGISWMVFTCPPTVATVPSNTPPDDWIGNDPCLVTIIDGPNFNDINDYFWINTPLSQPVTGAALTVTDNILYFVPITFYSVQDGFYSYSTGGLPCYEMGTPFPVQYLPEITFSESITCADVSVTINGGLPAVDGTNFTISNLLPANAVLNTTSVSNGGNVVITGLQNGQSYSFDITDGNGCPIQFAGGPFVEQPVADAGVGSVECILNYGLGAIPSVGTGTWSGAGVSFAPNTNDPNATVSATNPGTYTLTWTEVNGACTSSADVDVTLLNPITSAVTPSCTDVVVQLTGGHPEAFGTNFTISNVLPATATLSATSIGNNGTVLYTGLNEGDMYSFDVIDDNGCTHTISGGPFVATPVANAGLDDDVCSFSYDLNANPSLGVGTWTATGPSVALFSNTNDNSPTATATVTAAGPYVLTWTEDNGGCTDSQDITVQFSGVDYTNTVVSSTCGNADGEITLTGNNGIPTYQYSTDGGVTYQPGGTFTGLSANTYNISVLDNLNCEVTGTVTVSDQGGPEIIAVNPIAPSCNGGSDGSISIDATGATAFSIDNGATFQPSNVFLGLEDGTYLIAVTNAIGCEAYSTIEIIDPAELIFTTAPINLSCNGDCIGEIEVNALGGTGTLQYSNDNGANFSLGNTFTNLCAGDYDVVVEDANSCLASSIETITEPAAMSMTLNIVQPVCNSSCNGNINSIPLGGDGNYTYTWSTGQSIPFVDNLCSGQYDLNVTDGNGCFINQTVILAGPAAAVINDVIEVDESCPGACDGSLEVVATNVTQYSIDGVNFVAGPLFTNLCSGTYTVYAQDVNECSTDSLVEVGSPIAVGVSATAISPICIGGSSFLDGTVTGGTQPFTYEWSDNAGVVLFATEDGNVSPILDEVYTFTATDANGCSLATNVLVQVNDSLSLSVFGDTPICEGSPSNLSALASGGDGGPYTYTWDQGLGVGQNQSVFPTQTTVYTVTVTDGCQTPPISDQVTVTVNTVPAISFTGDQLSGCTPVTTNFTDNLVPTGSTCLWNFGDGGTSTQCGNPSYVFTQPGCWDVTLTITTAEGCVETVTIPNYVCVFAYPTADFTFGPQPTTVMHPTIDFVNLSSNADAYNWTFDVGGLEDQSTVEDPQYTFPNANPGTYEVCLEAITLDGCNDAICQNVLIDEEFILYVPNAFTPGGSDLINNEFKPIVKGEDPLKYSFMVFNRWGELIFETSYSSEGWDGTYKGLMSQQDVYVWKVTCTDASSKEPHEYIGHVTLLK